MRSKSAVSKNRAVRRGNCDLAEISFRRVSKYQIVQIVALTLAFIFSTAACLTLSYVNYVLTPDCLLFSTWTGSEKAARSEARFEESVVPNDTSTSTGFTVAVAAAEVPRGWLYGEYSSTKLILELNAFETKWGKKRHCYLTQYGFAAAAVVSFILCWFFVFFRPTREAYFLKKKTAASKFVLPAIIFCAAFVVCIFVACITLQMGVAAWCDSVETILDRCSSIRNYAVTYAGKTTYVDFFSVLVAAQVLCWFGATFWLVNLLTLAQRLYYHVDFPDYFFRPIAANHDQVVVVQSETDSE